MKVFILAALTIFTGNRLIGTEEDNATKTVEIYGITYAEEGDPINSGTKRVIVKEVVEPAKNEDIHNIKKGWTAAAVIGETGDDAFVTGINSLVIAIVKNANVVDGADGTKKVQFSLVFSYEENGFNLCRTEPFSLSMAQWDKIVEAKNELK